MTKLETLTRDPAQYRHVTNLSIMHSQKVGGITVGNIGEASRKLSRRQDFEIDSTPHELNLQGILGVRHDIENVKSSLIKTREFSETKQ